ncbi:MAG: hypothetical protein LQ337_006210 [Flavoplaca oasis]|nr:MAG: hypothetical protein LQ337_006210 [Flavoplaca oasis]
MAVPEISIKLSLSPATHDFSNPTAPELCLTVTSNADKPLTFFTWGTLFDPRLSLRGGCFVITDLTTGFEVEQTPRLCTKRGAFKRIRGCDDEKHFLTIKPGLPTTVSFSFGGANGLRPVPRGSERNGRVIDTAKGVDGLRPGHRYRLDVAEKPFRPWWHWGSKGDILVNRKDVGNRTLDSLEPEKASLKFAPVDGVEFCVEK